MDPFQLIMSVAQGARSEDELVNKLATQSAPPPIDFKPAVATPPMMPPAGAMMAGMPKSPLVGPQAPAMVPPMTQGEARTSPRIGEHLIGAR